MAVTKIQINNSNLIDNADKGYLNAAIDSGSSTITVTSINKFAVNQILLIGELGREGSEIIKTHASTAPTGNTVTLASNTVYDHSANTAVYIINYDQYELSHATTETGSKTLLTTGLGSGLLAIDPEQENTLYNDSEYTTGYYFVRKKETVGNTFSGYSDAIPASGYSADSVGYMIEQALREARVELSDDLTQQDCTRYLNEGLRLIQGKQVRWPEHQQLNYIAGETARGISTVTLPSDIYDSNSNRSLVGVRVGDDVDLTYQDPQEFEEHLAGTSVTQVRTEAAATDTSLAVDNSYDFADSGTVHVYVNNTLHEITYTGVTRDDATGATAALTGIPASGDGSITVTIPVDTNVWQGETEGTPRYYTIRNSALEIFPLPDSHNDNENVYLDYWTVATTVDSDGDTIDLQRYDILQDYLTWRIRMKIKNGGKLDITDGFYQQFKEKLTDAIRTSRSPFTHKMAPKLNGIKYHGRGGRFQYESQE